MSKCKILGVLGTAGIISLTGASSTAIVDGVIPYEPLTEEIYETGPINVDKNKLDILKKYGLKGFLSAYAKSELSPLTGEATAMTREANSE